MYKEAIYKRAEQSPDSGKVFKKMKNFHKMLKGGGVDSGLAAAVGAGAGGIRSRSNTGAKKNKKESEPK